MKKLIAILGLWFCGMAYAQQAPAPVDDSGISRPISQGTVWTPAMWQATSQGYVNSVGGTLKQGSIIRGTIDPATTVGGKQISDPQFLGFQTVYSQTIDVCPSGCAYSKVSDGWGAALSAAHRLFGHGVVILQIADGTYTETGQIYTTDPMGASVNVIGDTADNSKVVIKFTNIKGNNSGGFVADNGGIIGLIDGVTLKGVGAQSAHSAASTSWYPQSYGAGIIAQHNAVIALGAHVAVNSFYYSVVADDGGMVNARGGGVTGSDAGDVNFMARGNGTIVCTPCTANRAVDMTSPSTAILGGGFDAERGGSLYIDYSTCTNSNVACVTALSSGKAWAHNMTISSPLRSQETSGFWATENGIIEAQDSTINGMNVAVLAQNGGTAECDRCKIAGSYSDGVVSDGGLVLGTATQSQGSQTGYGYHALHQGIMHLYGVVNLTSENKLGKFAVETAGSANGATYNASSIGAN